MRFHLSLLLFLLHWLLGSQAMAFSFTAQTDRQQLFLGESLELTLKLDDSSYFVEPDISPLKQDFELLSSQRGIDNSTDGHSIQRWTFRLLPKRLGNLQIPSISLGRYSSNPVNIQVQAFQAPEILAVEPLYMDAHLDAERVYVQAQAILTLRIYHSLPLYGSGQLDNLNMPSARIEPLGEPRISEQFINGVRHGVIEMRYAIFAQQTGELTIPSVRFSAVLSDHDPASLAPPGNQPGQHLEVHSAQIPLQVLPPPAEFPTDALWLPASELSLEQQWSPADGPLNPDSALTRNLHVRILGLPASALPALLPQQTSHFYSYNGPLQNKQSVHAQGLLSLHHEQQVLISKSDGLYEIPAIRLPWWNTREDRLEFAILPARQVEIQPALTDTGPVSQLPFYQQLRLWQALSLLLFLSSLLLFTLWQHARRQPAIMDQPSTSNARLVENLKRACKNNDPIQARSALDALARNNSFTPNEAARHSSDFHNALTGLNAVLYAESNQQWSGQQLWTSFSELEINAQPDSKKILPPLYPP